MKRSRCALFLSALFIVLANPVFAIVRHVPGEYATIQAAIDASVTGDIVEIACGTYEVIEVVLKSGVALRSSTGLPDCVTVTQGVEGGRMLGCVANVPTTIEGITFFKGHNSGGGAIRLSGSVIVTRCKFISNNGAFFTEATLEATSEQSLGFCTNSGAAIIFDDSNALVTDCDFDWNGSSAGGIKACGDNVFANCRFNYNYGSEGDWGAIYTRGGTFTDCDFRNNHGYFGGGAAQCYQATFVRCLLKPS